MTDDDDLCHHNNIQKEYMGGMDTGDVICLGCGASWWPKGPKPEPKPKRQF